jgi:imidazolonepropionase-like amidohydrolase
MSRSSWLWLTLALLGPAPGSPQAAADAELVGTYRRGSFEVVFEADGRYRVAQGGATGVEGRYRSSGDTVWIVDESGPFACAPSQTGRYVARPSADSLTLLAVEDSCDGRRLGLTGAGWTRVRPEAPVALTHVTVIDGTGARPQRDMTLLIVRGRIADLFRSGTKPLPPDAQVLDLAGRFVIPGLIDSHVHLATDPSDEDRREVVERRLRNALRGGVTAVRDMAGDGRALADLSRAALVGDIESPAIYYAAVMAGPEFFDDPRVRAASRGVAPGTAPWARAVTAATDWQIAVAEAKGTGATGIKVYAAISAAVLRPLVAEAHRQGLRVWAHATLFPARPSEVVQAGVDVVSHASMLVWEGVPVLQYGKRGRPDPIMQPTDSRMAKLLHQMAQRGAILDATLFVSNGSAKEAAWSAAVAHEAWAAGVPISAGTDSIGVDKEGALPNIHEELRLLVERAGLSPLAALTAATRNGAQALGIEATRGTIAEGKAADLVVLSGDPTTDIRHTRDIVYVFRDGRRYAPLTGSR